MFDFRYHALSLAAVLFALTLGVLLGVAIGENTNLVSSAKNGVLHNLDSEVRQARSQAGKLHEQLTSEEAFATGLYPLAVHELLAGRAIGLMFLGGSSDEINTLVRNAVAQAGGQVTTVVAVREPLDLEALAHETADTHYAALASSVGLLESFGDLLGRQLVSGGQLVGRELISRVRASLLSAFDGQLTRLEGLVVVRAEPSGMSAEQSEAATALESGLLKGVSAVGVPAVGVELTGTEPSQISWYRGKGLSSVDNLDQLAGQAALDYALAGSHGAFGVKSTAESLLPSVTTDASQP
jgi:Copper transport outer membrane protein, MctB